MTDVERELFYGLIDQRQIYAMQRLRKNPKYTALMEQQEQGNERVEELLQQLEKVDRYTIRNHYEAETVRESYQLYEVYIQGLQDAFKLLKFLDVLQTSDVTP